MKNMTKIDVYNITGEKVGEMALPKEVFGFESNDALVHQVYVAQAANRRGGSAHAKTRSERRGGGRKPWKQKGTGNARTGSIRNPIWRGGGVIFGPLKNRNFKKNVNEKMKRKALQIALSAKARDGKIKIVDSLQFEDKKTKVVANMLSVMELSKSVLMGFSVDEADNYVAARNVSNVKTIPTEQLNVYDVLNAQYLLLSKSSVEQLVNKYTA